MKQLNDFLATRFYNVCEDIKNSLNSDDLNFHVGVACGFASALFLTDTIDSDCYSAMHEYIFIVREQCELGGIC